MAGCPTYLVRLDRALARYTGFDRAARRGDFVAALPPGAFDTLANRALTSGFFGLAKEAPVPTDVSTLEIAITYRCDTVCTKAPFAPTSPVVAGLAASIDSLVSGFSWAPAAPSPRE